MVKKPAGKDVKFKGRWRTYSEVAAWFVEHPSMRGVTWESAGNFLIGRKGSFEIKLKLLH